MLSLSYKLRNMGRANMWCMCETVVRKTMIKNIVFQFIYFKFSVYLLWKKMHIQKFGEIKSVWVNESWIYVNLCQFLLLNMKKLSLKYMNGHITHLRYLLEYPIDTYWSINSWTRTTERHFKWKTGDNVSGKSLFNVENNI